MNINELFTEVNKRCEVLKRPPVDNETFHIVLLTLTCKGLVKLTDNNTVYLEAVKRHEYMKEKMKEL